MLGSARQEWEEGHRRLEETARGDRARQRRLLRDVEAVREELRRHIGQTFTLAELDRAYRDADTWAREVVQEAAAQALVTAAAFHLHSRAALDYAP